MEIAFLIFGFAVLALVSGLKWLDAATAIIMSALVLAAVVVLAELTGRLVNYIDEKTDCQCSAQQRQKEREKECSETSDSQSR